MLDGELHSCCASRFCLEKCAVDWRANKTPPMGWNAWNTFSKNGTPLRGGRPEYESMAEAIVASGMRDVGYNVVSTVCTDWVGHNATSGVLLQNTTLWPGDVMKDFAGYLHGKGLLLSVYTNAGIFNYCGEPGSAGYKVLVMETFASWGADVVAVDFCSPVPGAAENVRSTFAKSAAAIAASSNPNLKLAMFNLALCRPWTWTPQLGAPCFRVTSDIGNTWNSLAGHPTMGVMQTVDTVQAIPDTYWRGVGRQTGSYPMYGQLAVGTLF